jgi:predicted alpha/beta superfamily hydrolase
MILLFHGRKYLLFTKMKNRKFLHFGVFGVLFCLHSMLAAGQDTSRSNDNKPFILGAIREIQSHELAEKRTLNIYFPEGYDQNDTLRYPVIYLLDGSADEDFIHIAGLVQFCNYPWVNMLPKSIVVGIANVDRKRDFTFPTTIKKDKKDYPTTGSSEKFISFIEKELQPFIDKNYKTNSSKTIIGQSLGGLLATEILFKKPNLFNKYIIVSPSLWWDKESLLSIKPLALSSDFNQKTLIYVAVGKEGTIMESDAKKLVSILTESHSKNIKLTFEFFPDENHASILHNAVYKAFQSFNELEKANKK